MSICRKLDRATAKSLGEQKAVASTIQQLQSEIAALKQQHARDLQEAIKLHDQERSRHDEDMEQARGLSGTKLRSDDYHAQHPTDCQRYFGFPTWIELKAYVGVNWPGADQSQTSMGYATRTHFEQILIAKMFLKTALDQADLARIWDTSTSSISKIVLKWCPRWGRCARRHIRLQHLPLKFLQTSQPEGFSERYHTLPATEVDGKDLRTENIRRDNLGKRLQNSQQQV